MANFSKSLKYGQAAETDIARYFMRKGYAVLPVYEKILDTGKGPQLFTAEAQYVAPDMLIVNGAKVFWIEAKRKSAFTWHRITGRWTTGIDVRHYESYCQIADMVDWPVWLLFMQGNGQAKDSPASCPAGLFGNDLGVLRACENHRSTKWAGGMVYWALGSLKRIASLGDVVSGGRSGAGRCPT